MSKLPRVWNKKTLLGARAYYSGAGGQISSLACIGSHYDIDAGRKYSVGNQDYHYRVGSLLVHPGCTYYGFENRNHQGKMYKFTGPVTIFNIPKYFGFCSSNMGCFRSFIVECNMALPDCVPSDEWTSVAYLDNSDSSFPTTFTYEYEIGTEWSSETSHGWTVDASVSATLTASFFGIFEAAASTTFSTGYNWQKTSYEAMSEVSTFNIEAEIPAGKALKIEQARGLCGGNSVRTDMFKTTEIKTGKSQIFYH